MSMVHALVIAFAEAGCLVEAEDQYGARLCSPGQSADIDLETQSSGAVLVRASLIGDAKRVGVSHWDYDSPRATVRVIADMIDVLTQKSHEGNNE